MIVVALFVGGGLLFAWWFVSRQAHARFGPKPIRPELTIEWLIVRAVRQYVESRREGNFVAVVSYRVLILRYGQS